MSTGYKRTVVWTRNIGPHVFWFCGAKTMLCSLSVASQSFLSCHSHPPMSFSNTSAWLHSLNKECRMSGMWAQVLVCYESPKRGSHEQPRLGDSGEAALSTGATREPPCMAHTGKTLPLRWDCEWGQRTETWSWAVGNLSSYWYTLLATQVQRESHSLCQMSFAYLCPWFDKTLKQRPFLDTDFKKKKKYSMNSSYIPGRYRGQHSLCHSWFTPLSKAASATPSEGSPPGPGVPQNSSAGTQKTVLTLGPSLGITGKSSLLPLVHIDWGQGRLAYQTPRTHENWFIRIQQVEYRIFKQKFSGFSN